jgi:hypothetical protein
MHRTVGQFLLGHDRPCDTRYGELHLVGQVVRQQRRESIDERL